MGLVPTAACTSFRDVSRSAFRSHLEIIGRQRCSRRLAGVESQILNCDVIFLAQESSGFSYVLCSHQSEAENFGTSKALRTCNESEP